VILHLYFVFYVILHISGFADVSFYVFVLALCRYVYIFFTFLLFYVPVDKKNVMQISGSIFRIDSTVQKTNL
jgi:hypothetical protein